ncbi:MAG: hypothetical protein LBG19_04195 [Prevotellaceae bacterium]|jgi:hypothetical protein|nr:hypothetical protein [Prevotellaceae bacterium]
MLEQITNYDEADAIKYIHEHISEDLQKRYDENTIGFILEIVYEYYEILEEDGKEDEVVNLEEMLAFVNASMNESDLEALSEEELKEILMADNAYMDSIDPEGAEDVVNLDIEVENIYNALPNSIKEKYSLEDVYLILCIEADYIADNDMVNEDTLREVIIDEAKEEDLEITLDDLNKILAVEAKVLGEE